MRAAPAKFLFENDFAAGASKPSMPLEEHAAKIRAAEAAAFARGLEQGRAEAKAEAEQRTAAAIERIAGAMAILHRQLGAVEARLEAEAVEVAVEVAKKLAPELIRMEPFTEIAALATGCFRNLVRCPHVAVRVHESLLDIARVKLDEIMRRCGAETKLVILGEPDIAPGDCRIEWADGGIDRDSAAVAAAIDEAVARYVNARRSGAGATNVKWK